MELSLIIPVYNGANTIGKTLDAVHAYLAQRIPDHEIIVINDGSSDATDSLLSARSEPWLRYHSLGKNSGKFAALRVGMQIASGRCRIFTDADLPYELEALTYMTALINERQLHIVIGDRTLADSVYVRQIPFLRRIATVSFSFFIKLFIIGGLYDTQCGLKGLRADVANSLFPLIRANGFEGDVELLYLAHKYNLEVKRIPVRLQATEGSTVRPIVDGMKMLSRISKLKLNWERGLYRSQALTQIAAQHYWKN